MTCDDDAAAAGGVPGWGNEVFGGEAGGGVDGAEGVCVGIRANAAEVEDGVGGEDVLLGAGGLERKGGASSLEAGC